jgi:Amt family ammonium transporter
VTPLGAVLIGTLAGVLVVWSVLFFEWLRIDDPVGAISVHGVGGAFGTISAALFHENLFTGQPYDLGAQLLTQLIGAGAAFLWTFSACFLLFKAIAATVGLRVSAEEELAGLDRGEHGANAYPDFALSPAAGGFSLGQAHAAHGAVATRAETAEA